MYIIAFVYAFPRLLIKLEYLSDFRSGINSTAYRNGELYYLKVLAIN